MIFIKYHYKEKIIKTCTIDYKKDITLAMALEAIKHLTLEMLHISKQSKEFVDNLIIEYSFDGINFNKYDIEIKKKEMV